jgi:hypothetical protein
MSNLLQRARTMFGYSATDADCISYYQRHIRSKVSSESCAKNGAKGFAALVAAGKGNLAGEKAADWRYEHPSDLERLVLGALQRLLPEYDISSRQYREVKVGRFYVDFKLGYIAIEVNDDTWHLNSASFTGIDVESRDAGKYAYLREQGLTVIILAEKAVRNGEAEQMLTQLKPSILEQLEEQEF